MKADLTYIDDVIERETTNRYENAAIFTDTDKSAAAKAAKRMVAGFEIHDEQQERKALDAMIVRRRATIDTFRKDRTKVRDKLAGLGITSLAIVPRSAWHAICNQAGLFRLNPDKQGRVGVTKNAFNSDYRISVPRSTGVLGKLEYIHTTLNAVNDGEINAHAERDWTSFLKEMFDGLVAPNYDENNLVPRCATLVLPQPPQDIVDILLKASAKEYLGLKVAAVAEAISFKETPAEIIKKVKKARKEEAEARRRAILADPIVYHEEGSVAAIVAQFGDFPVEKEVVDNVVASDKLIGEPVSEMDYLRLTTANHEIFTRAMSRMFSS